MNHHEDISSSASLSSRVITTEEEFDALSNAWQELFDASTATVFQSFEWQRTWWKYFGEGNAKTSLCIIVAENNGRVIGIAPFFIEKIPFLRLFTLRRLTFIGGEASDYHDVITLPEFASSFATVISKALVSSDLRFDLMLIENISENSETPRQLVAGLDTLGMKCSVSVNEKCPRTSLAATWEETAAGFSANFRSSLNRKSRNVEKQFPVRYEVTADDSTLDSDIGDLIALHQERWTGKGLKGVFKDDEFVSFHREVARLFFEKGWLFLSFLRLGEERIAAQYNFCFRETMSYYLGGFQERADVDRFSPGLLLFKFSMTQAIEKGLSTFDFLRGDEQYKYLFGSTDKKNYALKMVNPSSMFARPLYILFRVYSILKNRISLERQRFHHFLDTHPLFSFATLLYFINRTYRLIKRS